MLFAALFIVLSGAISIELGVSAAIVELLAGILAGPLLGVTHMPELDVLATLGIISLMYVAGLEIDFDLLRRNIKSSSSIGFSSFAVPFVLVSFVCFYLLGFTTEQTLLIGIALSTTSVAIVYPILYADGIDELEKKILASAMVADLFSMIVLSLIFSKISWLTVILVIALFLFSLAVPYFGKRIFSHFKGNVIEIEFKLILFIIVGLTIASENAGLESAIVAFLAGMITSEVVANHEDLDKKLRFIVFGLFAPIFFFTVGLTIDVTSVFENVGLLLVLLVTCMVGKFVGTYVPAKRFLPGKAKYMGYLFNSRLSLGIVASTFGFQAGIIDQSVYAPLIGTIVLASIVTSVFLRMKKK